MVEFVLCIGVFWMPLFLGTIIIGFNLIRAVQVTQVCRDAGHMYSYGKDFTQPTYQNLLVSLAKGLNMTTTSGNGVVILSTVTYIDTTQCKAGGYSSTCPNYQKLVFTRRVVVGNSSLHLSTFGTPNAGFLDGSGNVRSGDNNGTQGYLNDASAIASGFSNVVALSAGQYSYVSEMFVQSPDYDWWSFLGSMGVSARSIF